MLSTEITLPEIKVYNGQRVITFKDIDTIHQRPEGTASRNFKANRNRFIENEDYYLAKPVNTQKDEIRPSENSSGLGVINPHGLILLTESGYLLLVKSFHDDLAWDVQRMLVNCYFKSKEVPEQPKQQEPQHKYTYHGNPCWTIAEISDTFGISRLTATRYVKSCIAGNYVFMSGYRIKEFNQENKTRLSPLFIVTETGYKKLGKLFSQKYPNKEQEMLEELKNTNVSVKSFQGKAEATINGMTILQLVIAARKLQLEQDLTDDAVALLSLLVAVYHAGRESTLKRARAV